MKKNRDKKKDVFEEAETKEKSSCCCGAEKEETSCTADAAAEQKDGSCEVSGTEPETLSAAVKLKEAEAEAEKWHESYLRKAADFDNYRKRMLKEKQEAIYFANGNLLTDIVQFLDDLDRAVEAGEKHGGESAKAFMEGFVMIKKQLASMLESKYGLIYYPSKNEPFDPNIHEAVSIMQDGKIETPTVAEELRKGYKLKDRVLRSSQVVVLMPAKKEEPENKDNIQQEENGNTEQ